MKGKINLQIEENQLFFHTLKKGLQLSFSQTEFICISIDKITLYCYSLSTLHRVVKQLKGIEKLQSDNQE